VAGFEGVEQAGDGGAMQKQPLGDDVRREWLGGTAAVLTALAPG
jgi:hypothetical protein